MLGSDSDWQHGVLMDRFGLFSKLLMTQKKGCKGKVQDRPW